MARYRIRDKYDAHAFAMIYGFMAALIIAGLLEQFEIIEGHHFGIAVLAFPVAAGFAARWGWELRRRYRKSRPGYDALSSLRPKV